MIMNLTHLDTETIYFSTEKKFWKINYLYVCFILTFFGLPAPFLPFG